ncbi:MAG TPA: Gfo/Idh/MocA family oxidoreductase [Candidatus Binataceae bacterium]|jgi:predicted dehydrogenase|nr:Gfo/Idh/MocA family oxidoreductase [Candidatus Binataceae bacterium]
MLRGAISGFGEVAARGHLPGWASAPDIQIVAVHDPVGARRHLALKLLKNVRVYDNLELMLEGERLDFIDVASPPVHHAPTIRTALQKGVHVLVEKPLCLDLATLAELRREAADARRVLMCVHNWKHAPVYRRAHQLIASGRIGEVSHLSFERLRTAPAGSSGQVEKWRLDPHQGGGILIDHGWHVFYLMHWLSGQRTPRHLKADLGRSQAGAVDTRAELSIECDRAETRIVLSWEADRRSTTAFVRGADGAIAIEGNHLVVQSGSAAESIAVADADDDSYHPSWFASVADQFRRAVLEGPDAVGAAENLVEATTALALITAARDSAGRRVSVATDGGQ